MVSIALTSNGIFMFRVLIGIRFFVTKGQKTTVTTIALAPFTFTVGSSFSARCRLLIVALASLRSTADLFRETSASVPLYETLEVIV